MMSEGNPFKKLGEKELYSNPWIRVVEDQVIKPSGDEGIYGRVLFKNMAIGIIPVDEELNTWLVGQYRYTLEEYSWEIPMGGGLHEHTPLESAKRELAEETGLRAEKWENIMRIHTSNCVTDEVGYVFVARGLTQGEMDWDDTEQLVIKKVPFAEALDMVMRQEITDSLSVAGILKVARMLGV